MYMNMLFFFYSKNLDLEIEYSIGARFPSAFSLPPLLHSALVLFLDPIHSSHKLFSFLLCYAISN